MCGQSKIKHILSRNMENIFFVLFLPELNMFQRDLCKFMLERCSGN